ncbi:helix-turn-helix domain-containing protein [Methanomassiliicoccales archaeon LGM-RCC1]|nr:helix-turn-helix domain-containing protein [Methanomassiliicoccales archaeon LGM-RCC1]
MTVDVLSLEAYASLGSTKEAQAQIILDTIRKARHPSSADIERLTKIKRTSVTARLKKLEDDGLIYKAGTKKDPFTHKTVNWYGVIA